MKTNIPPNYKFIIKVLTESKLLFLSYYPLLIVALRRANFSNHFSLSFGRQLRNGRLLWMEEIWMLWYLRRLCLKLLTEVSITTRDQLALLLALRELNTSFSKKPSLPMEESSEPCNTEPLMSPKEPTPDTPKPSTMLSTSLKMSAHIANLESPTPSKTSSKTALKNKKTKFPTSNKTTKPSTPENSSKPPPLSTTSNI